MDAQPPEPGSGKPFSFWRWLVKFYGRVVFYSVFIAALLMFVVVPTWETNAPRRELLDALDAAREVRLEEFVCNEVTAVKKLSPAEISQVRNAVPFRVMVGLPGLRSCWWPHHRVAVVKEDDSPYAFEICFHCQMTKSIRARNEETGPTMPHPTWLEGLRKLFVRNGIPVRSDYKDNEPPDFPVESKPDSVVDAH